MECSEMNEEGEFNWELINRSTSFQQLTSFKFNYEAKWTERSD